FFMWGGSRAVDKYSGQNYEHRRGWVEDRLLFLASIFAIDSAATVFVLTQRYLTRHPTQLDSF
ncbi:MAG: hypothetical protein ACJAV1_003102, partial [Paraglaciecola sp.]